MPADVIRAGQPAHSCRGCICSWEQLHWHRESYSCLPTPSSFLVEVSQVLIIFKHLLLPQMTLETGKVCLSQRLEDWDHQAKPYTNLINFSNSFRIVFLFLFWINFSIITQKKKQIGNKKVLLTQMQLGSFKFPFGELWSSSLVPVQNKAIKRNKTFSK